MHTQSRQETRTWFCALEHSLACRKPEFYLQNHINLSWQHTPVISVPGRQSLENQEFSASLEPHNTLLQNTEQKSTAAHAPAQSAAAHAPAQSTGLLCFGWVLAFRWPLDSTGNAHFSVFSPEQAHMTKVPVAKAVSPAISQECCTSKDHAEVTRSLLGFQWRGRKLRDLREWSLNPHFTRNCCPDLQMAVHVVQCS